ncbi:MAG: hydroxyacid dehydrogenase [Prolixibacteraceae bacterium]|jgi:D-3-phosphoglycerate dehydrogenase|nr:hydroxyacid dehydrogenase [Prolixibacteraceae bacterium]
MKPKVLLSEDINPLGKKLLEGKMEIIIAPDTSKETAKKLVKDVEGVILRATTKFDTEVIESAEKLKVIARTGVGVDNVDIEAANRKGILVCNFPGMNNLTVAEHTITLIMALAKQVVHMHRAVKDGRWAERFSPAQTEVEGKILGVVGMGQIGRLVAQKCRDGLGMEILAYDPFVKGGADEFKFTGQLEELFSASDFVTLHVPSLPETKGLVSQKLLGLMKKTAFLVNTSRGELVDEGALFRALQAQTIKGAALDVFREEPLPTDSPFISLPNVILSPHCAGSTWESNVRIAVGAAQAVLDVVEGRLPEKRYIFNTELVR